MNITYPKINEYILNVLSPSDEVLNEMEKLAAQIGFPIIGPMVGPFLRQLAIALDARNIFEMGSGYGYSAYWFAGGMKKGGKLVCTDGSEDNKQKALGYLQRGGFESLIDYRVGDACDIIQQFDGPFDIILNDINKEDYPKAFDLALPRLHKGGIFVTDNVLRDGKILNRKPDKATRGVLEFNHKLFNTPGILSSILPIRDGLGIAVKL